MGRFLLGGLCSVGLLPANAGCGSDGSAPTPVPTPAPVFDVQLTSSAPASGGVLDLASPNDTPVALTVSFRVTVPPGQGGTYFWTTVVQAAQPPGSGFVVPVVTTPPLQAVTLTAGTQTIAVSDFRTTNAVCYTLADRPTTSLSLDVEIKTLQSFAAPAEFGKKYPVIFTLRCS